jgi:5-methyltetrahydropteroyltriglutamate--homocysteine methyltransferase
LLLPGLNTGLPYGRRVRWALEMVRDMTASSNTAVAAKQITRRTRPPFRADQVGSLLRPQHLLEARSKVDRGELTAAELRRIEDEAVRQVVRRQEEVGLKAVTDGEFRRRSWHMDFICRIGGVISAGTQMRPFHNEQGAVRNEIEVPKVVGRLRLNKPIFADDFAFLKSVTKATPKFSIPSPSMLHGLGSTLEDKSVYANAEEFWHDLAKVYVDELWALDRLGCTYLQIDDTMFATLGDPDYRRKLSPLAGAQDQLHMTYIRLLNDALAQKPPAMTVCVHTCRGNHRSAWVASGGYDAVAEAVFNELKVDGFFLEYDDERSGTFEALRFVPKGKMIVLGLITSKKGKLENKDDVKRRIEAATKYIDLDQLALSPQCGFASTLLGNLLTEDEQFAKLGLAVEIAKDVWGE